MQAGQLDEGLDFVKSEVRILRIRVESGARNLHGISQAPANPDQIDPDQHSFKSAITWQALREQRRAQRRQQAQ